MNGGEGWIRTSVRLRGQIYSLLPLTTRPPLHRGSRSRRAGQSGRRAKWRRGMVVSTRARAKSCRPSRALVRSRFQQSAGLSKSGAGEGNRTLVVSLEGFCSTIELHPPTSGPMPFGHRRRQPPDVDQGERAGLGCPSHDAPERHRRSLDRRPLVAFVDLCGAMARLID